MIDSHTHLFLCERPEAELIADALAAGVTRMLNVGLGGEENGSALAAAERHEAVFASVGCHPTEASGFDDARAEEIARLAAHEKVRAIGETGIDYYRDLASPADQRRPSRRRSRSPASAACRSSSTLATRTARRGRSTRSSTCSTPRPAIRL
jgi:TatD DNase family protein